MTDVDLTTGQRCPLQQLTHTGRRLHRDFDGAFCLDPQQPRDLPEPRHPADVEPLIEAGLLVVKPTPSVWLGHRIVLTSKEI
ncbi:hypothetical protein [Actinoplanes sp. NPDC051494]|uniref:hypothetical protein n=1 Tax=Actinoplanes sp. NPDC051494 TaxID=3363907 RepID=UPI003791B55C